MKTSNQQLLQADPVISEVRRVKTALAAKHNFDVLAMVKALQEREKKLKSGVDISHYSHHPQATSSVAETP